MYCIVIFLKGVLQTVKDWLTPSKWTNPWDEQEEEMADDPVNQPIGSTHNDEVMETPVHDPQSKHDDNSVPPAPLGGAPSGDPMRNTVSFKSSKFVWFNVIYTT